MPYRLHRLRPLLLVVDDDEMQRFLYREALEPNDFEIVEATDGAAAIAIFAKAKPDLVLLDVDMPGLDGFEVCQAIRATAMGATTPILMATARDDIEAIESSYQVGATDFISKPVNWALLPHRIRYVLRADHLLNNFILSERLLADAQRIAALGSFQWSSGSRIVRWSAESARIFGDENLAGSTSLRSILRQIPASDRARVVRAFRQARSGDIIELDHELMLPGGETRTVSLRAEMIREDGGESLVHGTYQDITDRKGIERALQMARDDARMSDAAKTAFLAAMSHELRTPLNAIIGFSELIAMQAFGPIANKKYVEFSQSILDAGRRIFSEVDDVLTIAQLESRTYQLRMEILDLAAVAKLALHKFRQTPAAIGREITFQTSDDEILMPGDEHAVRQMLSKLLSNAAKFSAAGSPIAVILDLGSGGSLRLSIADQGVGMNAEEAELAILPFRQVDGRLARKYEGAGLGLSITKALIDGHGGQMEIVSAPMEGTRVVLSFPSLPVGRKSRSRVAVLADDA
jgi:PAS domain S-box-containing protein